MIAEISAGYASLKGALDIAKGLNAVADAVALNDAKIGLQGAIIEAQSSLLAAQEAQAANLKRIAELEHEIVELKSWEADKQRYELKDTGKGTLAYALKAGMENGEPAHWLCPVCFQQGAKSILKHEHAATGRVHTLNCHPCGLDLLVAGLRSTQNAMLMSKGR
jgi:Zn finger protein HypA/HybF involved in hydrogenase expression